ncbi:hypothetical protein OH76DRAFT_1408224 [Lentinus brumalis]|uniref:Uncharacterized protein n=1 Tax=Lentinus brumalis TaxID=2498619 RepID=A0A371CY96_9APHY|nr:hypothetical protein OH76DRAFT_1408224 [Polyporus brumalis]
MQAQFYVRTSALESSNTCHLFSMPPAARHHSRGRAPGHPSCCRYATPGSSHGSPPHRHIT